MCDVIGENDDVTDVPQTAMNVNVTVCVCNWSIMLFNNRVIMWAAVIHSGETMRSADAWQNFSFPQGSSSVH